MALACAALVGGGGKSPWRGPVSVILLACTAVLPLLASRHMPLFGLACVVLTAEHIADAWDRTLPVVRVPVLGLSRLFCRRRSRDSCFPTEFSMRAYR